MEVIVFGVGRFYRERKDMISSDVEIVAFLDNNIELQGKTMDTRPIVSPMEVKRFSYDKIILMSASEEAMKSQLLELGIEEEKIWYWERFISEMYHGTFKFYCACTKLAERYRKKILIISTDLNYNGGTIAAVYAAKVLQECGNLVILAAPGGDKKFIKETTDSGINIMLCPALPYVQKEELFWIKQFDVVMVNVFQMILCAYEISKIRPVLWWIHEPRVLFVHTIKRFQKIISIEQLERVGIYAVSDVPQRNFNFYFSDKMRKLLPYGIPDQRKKAEVKEKKEHLIFAVIGMVCSRKAQDIFLKAIELLSDEEKIGTQFWIIGLIGDDDYGRQIKEMASGRDAIIKIKGQLTRSEMHEEYKKIDVVVCSSLEDPLPIVVTEGMMYEKVCIVSDTTGIARYIKNGEDGLVCKNGDPEDLCEKMRWVIHNREKSQTMGSNARKIYEKYFSMKAFGRRLETALQDTVNKWERAEGEKKGER